MSAPLGPGDVVRLRDLVRERVGLSFPQSRLADVESAVRKTLAETGLPDAAALYQLLTQLARHQEPLDALVSALNVNETHFHRDRNQIRALSERIPPEIILPPPGSPAGPSPCFTSRTTRPTSGWSSRS